MKRRYQDLPASDRTRWIIAHRGKRTTTDYSQPHSSFLELERAADSRLLPTLTVLLRSRECPWHCLMCDLWKHTASHPVPPRAIPAQLDQALANSSHPRLGRARQIKLYNSGSFFDAGAVPPADYSAIAKRLYDFERVIVECHPKLVNDRAHQFRNLLSESQGALANNPPLEVAMGLETVHPIALERLNKGMTLDDFRRAADFLLEHQIALRAFVLVHPPFVPSTEALEWVRRSVTFAFDCGASAVSLIPTRLGNGALDALAQTGNFSMPSLRMLEDALDEALSLRRGRVFADLWDLEKFVRCKSCFGPRRARLESMNLDQTGQPPLGCEVCSEMSAA